MDDMDVLGIMRENAALCGLEAEVIITLKLFEAGYGNAQAMAEQLSKINNALLTVDAIRKRNAQR